MHTRFFILLILLVAAFDLAGCTTQSTVSLTPIGSPVPPRSSLAAPPLTPIIDCAYDAQFIQDLSVPDGTHLRPGTVFTKTWQIRNNSQCEWTPEYQLKFIGGARLNEASVNLPHSVSVGDTLDLSIVLTAPVTAGQYKARWRLFAADGTPFGPTLFADINVP